MQSVLTSIVLGLSFFHLQDNPTDIQSLKTMTFQLVPIYFYLSELLAGRSLSLLVTENLNADQSSLPCCQHKVNGSDLTVQNSVDH